MTGLAPEIPEDLYMLIKKVMPIFHYTVPVGLLTALLIDESLSLTSIRPSLSASISKRTARTRTPNSALFLSNPEFTVCRDTTRPLVCYLLLGDTRVQPQAQWSHELMGIATG